MKINLGIFRFSLLFIPLLLSNCQQTERTEAITAEITAAQIEGRKAAGQIIGPKWEDTLKLERALLDAKTIQSKYLIQGKPECAEAFDSAFISTIRTVNPDLARKIKN